MPASIPTGVKNARPSADRVGLGDRIHHKPMNFPAVNVNASRSRAPLVNGPSIVLADEPTGNLDSKTGEES